MVRVNIWWSEATYDGQATFYGQKQLLFSRQTFLWEPMFDGQIPIYIMVKNN